MLSSETLLPDTRDPTQEGKWTRRFLENRMPTAWYRAAIHSQCIECLSSCRETAESSDMKNSIAVSGLVYSIISFN